ncbi:O-acetylhomoserine aminocarboxypropyltransferase [Corynebacterium diphtheriae]|nr:O-acetylhomoserine aminocarboxypropyltransferase [Corynebacterium diphtheriae]
MPTKYDNSNTNKWGFETRSIHAGQSVDSDTGARNLPIYLTSSYVFNDAEHAANRFNLSDAGPVYSRLTNPTVAAVEERLANLEGGVHAVLFASGMAAETAAILNIARAGSHIVSSPRIYGGTETLFAVTLARLGIETTFVENPDDPASWEAAIQNNTVALYGETFANPQADVLDIPAIAEVAHKYQVPLIVDNTLATAALVRPLELGADVVVASLTKFYTGNGSGLGGVLVDGGNFDWTVTRNGEPIFPDFVTPDPAYHGLKYADLGAPAFGLKARVGLLRDTGAAPSPLNAWITAQGLDTLSLRVQRHNENALAVAQFLANHDKVAKVNYAGLPDSPWYPVKEKLGFDYTGSVLSFDVKGGKDEAWRFIDALKLHSNLANVGDVRSS